MTSKSLKIVVAPDSFKGSATAVEVAEAIRVGWLAARTADVVVLAPMADGGEGTVDAFETAFAGSIRHEVVVTGPDGRPVTTEWLELPDGRAVVELASSSGISLLHPLAPMTAHTRGFGQAIAAALDFGSTSLVLAIGGSSSTDGGVGALRELGARFLTEESREIGDGGGALNDLAHVDLADLRPLPAGGAVILSDVTNPLLGEIGAAGVFGPQKGATDAEVGILEDGLRILADLMPADPASQGSGAAGGVGFGLLAWGADLWPGSAAVGDALGLPSAIATADIVVTGEGRFDSQSLAGKVPSYILSLAEGASAATAIIAGAIQTSTERFVAAESLSELAGSAERAIADPIPWVRDAAERIARSIR